MYVRLFLSAFASIFIIAGYCSDLRSQLISQLPMPLGSGLKKAPIVQGGVPSSQWILNNGSQGKEFVFCLPLNDCPTCQITAREIYVTCSKNTNFTYEVPALGFKRRMAVKAFQVTIIDGASGQFPMPEIEVSESNSDLGMSISADDPVSVYVYNGKNVSSDGYLAIPVQSWGTEYYHLGYPDFSEVRPWKGGFAFFASEDNTDVDIFLRSPSYGEYATSGLNKRTEGGHKYGDRWKVTLMRGQCYLVQGDGTSRGQFDLSGSHIKSSKPVGFISYHQRTMIPVFGVTNGRDHICEMIPPTSQWGKTYVSIEILRGGLGDLYRAVALQDGTNITWSSYDFKTRNRTNGPTGILNMKSGEVRSIPKSPEEPWVSRAQARGVVGMSIYKSNKPFLLMHESPSAEWDGDGNYDPFIIYVVPSEQYTKGTIFQCPLNNRYTNHFFGLIAIGDTLDPSAKLLKSIKMDGKFIYTITPSFLGNNIPGTNFYYARIPISSGAHNILGDTPFGGEIYGYGQFDSYGWPAATAFKTLSVFDTLPPVLTPVEECGDFTYQGTELRNFKINDTLNHVETGVSVIDFVDSLAGRSYNYRIVVTNSDGKLVQDGQVPTATKNERITFRLEVVDRKKDAFAKFFVQDRAFNITIDSVRWLAPKIVTNPTPIDFGNVRVGTTKSMKVWLKNLNDSAEYIKAIKMLKGAVFSVSHDSIPDSTGLVIQKKDSILVTISYSPVAEGVNVNNFDFDSLLVKEFCADFAYYVRGRGVMPHIRVGDFHAGIVSLNEKVCNTSLTDNLLIQNVGTDTLHVAGIDESVIKAPFYLVKPTTPPFTFSIPPGGREIFKEICFSPSVESNYTLDVAFLSDAPVSAKDDPISNWTGSSNAPGPYVVGNDWDSVRLGVSKQLKCWVGNTGTDLVVCSKVDTLGTSEFVIKKIERDPPFTVYANRLDSVRVDVVFTPTVEGAKSPFIVGDFEKTSSKRDSLKGFGYLEKIKATGAIFKDTLLVGTPVVSSIPSEFVSISNTSTSRWLNIKSIDFINEADDDINFIYPRDFAWVRTPPADTILEINGATVQLPVRFIPTKAGIERVRVRIVHNAEPITATPSGTWVDTVLVIGYGTIQNPPYIRGYNFGSVLACDPKVGTVIIGNSAKSGSTNSDRVLDSLWLTGADAAYFNVLGKPTSANPIVIAPDSKISLAVGFVPGPLTNRNYKAFVYARFNDGVILVDSLLANVFSVAVDVAVNEPQRVVNLGVNGSSVPMSLRATSSQWSSVGLSRFTAFIRYGLFDMRYLPGTLKIGPSLDNTWKIDSVKEVKVVGVDSTTLVVTCSGTTPVSTSGDLLTFDLGLLINSLRSSEFHTSLAFLPQNNVPDTTRDECVVVTTRGNTTVITGCYIDARFVNISELPFALRSINPHPATEGVTTISYSVAYEAPTRIDIVDDAGKIVSTPIHETQKKGSYNLVVDLRSFNSGLYHVQMSCFDKVYTLPLIIAK